MKTKAFEIIETKTAPNGSGEFTALVSVFGNVDYAGDRMVHGAFKRTLKNWRDSGDPLPIVLSHNWDDVMAHIGVADPRNVKETSKGLMVKGTLDIEDNPVAAQVHKLMKRRSLKEFSFGYTVPEGGESIADDGAMDVEDVDLIEIGPTLKGANPATELLAVKSALGIEEEESDPEDLRKRTFALKTKATTEVTPEDNALAADLADATERLGQAIEEHEELRKENEELKAELAESAKQNQPSEEVLRRQLANERLKGVDTNVVEEFEKAVEELRGAMAENRQLHERVQSLEGDIEAALKELAEAKRPSEEELRRQLAKERLPEENKTVEPAEDDITDEHVATAKTVLEFIQENDLDLDTVTTRLAAQPETVEEPETRIEDGADEEPSSAKSSTPQDSLKRRSDQIALELARGDLRDGIELPPSEEPAPIDEAKLRRRAFDLMLEIRG